MAAKDLSAAQGLIKSPTAKSSLAMGDYSARYAGAMGRALPGLGYALAVAEEANRVNRAQGVEETARVVTVGFGNTVADGVVTTSGMALGAKGGAILGGFVGSFVPVVGTGIGAIIGGVGGAIVGASGGHGVYDTQVAPRTRAVFIGEHFRDAN